MDWNWQRFVRVTHYLIRKCIQFSSWTRDNSKSGFLRICTQQRCALDSFFFFAFYITSLACSLYLASQRCKPHENSSKSEWNRNGKIDKYLISMYKKKKQWTVYRHTYHNVKSVITTLLNREGGGEMYFVTMNATERYLDGIKYNIPA